MASRVRRFPLLAPPQLPEGFNTMSTNKFAKFRAVSVSALAGPVLAVALLSGVASESYAKNSSVNGQDVSPAVSASFAEEAAQANPVNLQEAAATDAAPMSSQAFSFSGDSANDAMAAFGPPSGTTVSKRALELRDDVLRLRSSVNLNAGEFSLSRANGAAGAVQYHSTVAAITARLQNGTTRGNPILLRQWDEAETSLNQVTSSLERLNSLQTSVSADASLSSYLLESVQAAFQLSGAVDEDHDQLKLLRDEVSRMIVQLDYLRNQVADDIQRQTAYLTAERSNLQSLAFAISRGELMGNSLANRPVVVNPSPVVLLPTAAQQQTQQQYAPAFYQQQAAPAPMAGQPGPEPMSPREYMQESGQLNAAPPVMPSGDVGVAPTAGRLLVLIRYNQPVVEYEQQLSRAVGTALQRKSDAEFSVVAVTPASGDPGELATAQEAVSRNAEAVKRSLVQLGLAPSRISVASTQAASAQAPEVHVYIR